MTRVPMFDPIAYLVRRRFPDYNLVLARTVPGYGVTMGGLSSEKKRRLAEIEELQEELRALSPGDLSARLIAEQNKEQQEMAQKAEREEKARFFHQSYANADFFHWSKATYWTLDEAIALSFGKAPEVVNWEKVQSLASISPFALQYSRVRDLAHRAKNWEQLYALYFLRFFSPGRGALTLQSHRNLFG